MRKRGGFRPTTQRFFEGETVYVFPLKRNAVIESVSWNGLTWMVSFKGEELRCGDEMLSRELKKEAQA
jgi:hypothetical protein